MSTSPNSRGLSIHGYVPVSQVDIPFTITASPFLSKLDPAGQTLLFSVPVGVRECRLIRTEHLCGRGHRFLEEHLCRPSQYSRSRKRAFAGPSERSRSSPRYASNDSQLRVRVLSGRRLWRHSRHAIHWGLGAWVERGAAFRFHALDCGRHDSARFPIHARGHNHSESIRNPGGGRLSRSG